MVPATNTRVSYRQLEIMMKIKGQLQPTALRIMEHPQIHQEYGPIDELLQKCLRWLDEMEELSWKTYHCTIHKQRKWLTLGNITSGRKYKKRLWPKEQHRGSDNSSTRTGLKHQIHRGRSLSQPTGPKLQTIIKGPQETAQHIVPGCKMQAWTTYTRHKWGTHS